jgi:crotonobetainyl-CoA:carnitine CoA-transferase CaiB-like acyl-CoA transferase
MKPFHHRSHHGATPQGAAVVVLGLTGSYSCCPLAIAGGIGHESPNNNIKRPRGMGDALEGLRVLDLSESVAGQFCCRMLADFGAEVTLVEPPQGSSLRSMPPFDPQPNGLGSLLFFHLNLGKHSIALDHRSSEGWNKLLSLAASADVVVVGPGIDRAALERANPNCVVALVSDFGEDGPYQHWRGSEMIFQALSGMMQVNGSAGREPLYGVAHRASCATGVGAYITILSALYARGRIGRGQQVAIDVAMNTSSMAPPSSLEFAYSRMKDPRGERRSPFCVVKCSDGWVSIWVHLHIWSAFCAELDLKEIEHDPRFAKGKERQDNWAVFTQVVQDKVRNWTTDELMDRLLRARVAAAKAYSPSQLFHASPHLAERKYWESVETASGPRPILGAPFRMSKSPRRVRGPAPRLGADNAAAVPAKAAARASQLLGARHSEPSTDRGPLAGLRVLDFTTAWAGPMTGRILAFLGAQVIKVEAANRLDGWRGHDAVPSPKRLAGGVIGERAYNRSALFNSQNHNKLSLTLDIKNPKGLATVHRLAAITDVLICNFTAGTLNRMGLGYEALRKVKSDIIVLEMPGFGNTGPLSKAAANGATMEMAAGMCAMIGYPGGPPTTTGQVYPDPMGGYNGAAAVLTALMHREHSGEGQYIEMSQVEAAMQFVGEELLYAIASGKDPEPEGNHVRWAAPHDAYAADGDDQWVTIAVGSDDEWRKFGEITANASLADDPRYARFEQRQTNQDTLREPIERWTRQHTKLEIADKLQAAGIRAAAVLDSEDLHRSPYLKARGAFTSLTHPEAGTHDYQTLPFRLSVTPGAQRAASPPLGAHTQMILKDILRLSTGELDDLNRDGVTSNVPAAGAR